jgi:lactoylglutathione lyase
VFVSGLVNVYTRDIEAGMRFYLDLLGFSETFRTPKEGVPEHVEFELGALVVWVDDVDTAFGELVAAGVRVVQPPHTTGDNRSALLRDPDGNLVEIVAKVS